MTALAYQAPQSSITNNMIPAPSAHRGGFSGSSNHRSPNPNPSLPRDTGLADRSNLRPPNVSPFCPGHSGMTIHVGLSYLNRWQLKTRPRTSRRGRKFVGGLTEPVGTLSPATRPLPQPPHHTRRTPFANAVNHQPTYNHPSPATRPLPQPPHHTRRTPLANAVNHQPTYNHPPILDKPKQPSSPPLPRQNSKATPPSPPSIISDKSGKYQFQRVEFLREVGFKLWRTGDNTHVRTPRRVDLHAFMKSEMSVVSTLRARSSQSIFSRQRYTAHSSIPILSASRIASRTRATCI